MGHRVMNSRSHTVQNTGRALVRTMCAFAHGDISVCRRARTPRRAEQPSPPDGTATSPGTTASEQVEAPARDAPGAAASAHAKATSACVPTTSARVPATSARVPVPSACGPQARGLVQRIAAPGLRRQARGLILLLPPLAELLRAVQHGAFQLVILLIVLPIHSGALALAHALAAGASNDLGVLGHVRIGLLHCRLARSGNSEATQTGA